jgi:hypothetical protein
MFFKKRFTAKFDNENRSLVKASPEAVGNIYALFKRPYANGLNSSKNNTKKKSSFEQNRQRCC